jgi:hypothetical protein
MLKVVTSDYVAAAGDNLLAGVKLAPDAITILDHVPMREALIAGLRAWPGRVVDGADRKIYDATRPRLKYAPPRPMRCTPTAMVTGGPKRGPT